MTAPIHPFTAMAELMRREQARRDRQKEANRNRDYVKNIAPEGGDSFPGGTVARKTPGVVDPTGIGKRDPRADAQRNAGKLVRPKAFVSRPAGEFDVPPVVSGSGKVRKPVVPTSMDFAKPFKLPGK